MNVKRTPLAAAVSAGVPEVSDFVTVRLLREHGLDAARCRPLATSSYLSIIRRVLLIGNPWERHRRRRRWFLADPAAGRGPLRIRSPRFDRNLRMVPSQKKNNALFWDSRVSAANNSMIEERHRGNRAKNGTHARETLPWEFRSSRDLESLK